MRTPFISGGLSWILLLAMFVLADYLPNSAFIVVGIVFASSAFGLFGLWLTFRLSQMGEHIGLADVVGSLMCCASILLAILFALVASGYLMV